MNAASGSTSIILLPLPAAVLHQAYLEARLHVELKCRISWQRDLLKFQVLLADQVAASYSEQCQLQWIQLKKEPSASGELPDRTLPLME